MTRWQQARELKEQHGLTITVPAICSRLQRGWSLERIINTPNAVKATTPPDSHPLKRGTFTAMAKRKGWNVKIR